MRGGHKVKYDDQGVLPDGTDWAFVEVDGQLWLVVKREAWSPALMAKAWSEYAYVSWAS